MAVNRLVLLLIMTFSTLNIIPLSAQNTSNQEAPLLQMLALVPDNAESRAWLNFIDYRALEAGRSISTPSASEILSGSDESGVWVAAFMSVYGGIDASYLMSYLEGMPEAVGFSFLDIDQVMTFGMPPGTAYIMNGDFDAAAVDTAYTARGYQQSEVQGLTAWCGPQGCDSGLKANLQSRNPANPFGGALGREEPLLVLPEFLVNSADWNVLQSVASVSHEEQASLANVPEYRALAEAVSADGRLNQVMFINAVDTRAFDFGTTPAEAAERIQEMFEGYGELPAYSLAGLADIVDRSDQLAVVALVFDSEAAAQQAGAELEKRFINYRSLVMKMNMPELLETRAVSLEPPRIYTSETTGKSVLLFSLRSPVPANEPAENGRFVQSGLAYALLVEMYNRRDMAWLAWEFTASQ